MYKWIEKKKKTKKTVMTNIRILGGLLYWQKHDEELDGTDVGRLWWGGVWCISCKSSSSDWKPENINGKPWKQENIGRKIHWFLCTKTVVNAATCDP